MTTVRYLTVAQWGGRWAGTPALETLLDPEVYIHHIGAPGVPWPIDDAIRQFLQLNEFAINSKDYSFLDYDVLTHYSRSQDVISIGEGRGKYRSAATLDRNEQGEAVLACGNFDLRDPLPQELEALALGVKFGMDNGWVSKAAVGSFIRGHRDNPAHLNATSCPGGRLYARLGTVRTRVSQLLGAPPVVVQPTPPSATPPKVMKYGGTRTAGWGGWYSMDGKTRLAVADMAGARHMTITLDGVDAKTGRPPSDPYNWTDVSHTNDVAELDRWLTPLRPVARTTYTVRSGDGWIACARGLGMADNTWPQVQAANGGEQRQLIVGQVVYRPGFAYVVRPGDGWWAVCRGLGLDPAVALSAVQTRNGGAGNALTAGEVIYAP